MDEYEVYQRNAFPPEPEAVRVPEGFNIYSFRAECPIDVVNFLHNAYEKCMENDKRLGALTVLTDKGFPDCQVEFLSDYSLEKLQDIMREQEDSHVMIDTIRPVPMFENSMRARSLFSGDK